MSDEKLTALERRLADAEHAAETMRTEIQVLRQEQQRRSGRWRRDGMLLLLGLVAVFTLGRSLDTEAQGPARPMTVKAPFIVVDEQNKPIVTIEQQKESARGIFVQNEYGHRTAAVTTLPTGDGMIWVKKAGAGDYTPLAVAIGVNEQGNGGVRVRSADKLVVDLGSDPVGHGRILLNDAQQQPIVKLQEKTGTTGRGLIVFNPGAKTGASVTADPKGGVFKVFNASGVSVGGLLGGDSGGSVELTGPAGGKSAVSLSVEASGGKMRVFPDGGGTAQAELAAASSGGGALTLYSTTGTPSALLQTGNGGSGRLELSRSGVIFVEAGVSQNRGIVRAGPVFGGPPLGGLGFSDTIMGKVK